MSRLEYFFYLFRQGFTVGSFWYLAFLFCLLFILVIYKTFKVDKMPYKKIYLLSLIPFLFPALMLIWGTFFEHTQSYTENIPAWQFNALTGILFLQFVINLACIIYFKGVRLSLAALTVFQMYFTLPFYLVAIGSVSGVVLSGAGN